MGTKDHKRRTILVPVAIAAAIAAAYWPVLRYDFINYDDLEYITQNPYVRHGLTWLEVQWAFTTYYASNWHPVTWLSHMLDWQVFGPAAGGHHATNLVLHAVNAALLNALLWRLSGSFWRSTAVAALFALHPLQVESVAWVSERKNLLSVTFGLLSLYTYARYVRSATRAAAQLEARNRPAAEFAGKGRPASGAHPERDWLGATWSQGHPWFWYTLSVLLFALGLMSKPMVVTLPFIMLLLDWWPLGRFALQSTRAQARSEWWEGVARVTWFLVEKLPFFLLSLGSCVITLVAQSHGGAVLALEEMPLASRIGNAMISYVRYAAKTFCPTHLAAFYPHPGTWPVWQEAAAGALLLLVSVAAVRQARKRPALFVGWLWFVGSLVPVIGLVQVGRQSMADRYIYLPIIGLLLAVVWPAAELPAVAAQILGVTHQKRFRQGLWLGSVSAIAACAILSSHQVRYWQDGEHLFTHALAVTGENAFAQAYLGNALVEKGRLAEGVGHLEKAAQLRTAWPEVQYSLAFALGLNQDWTNAAAHYRRALHLRPDYPAALNNLAWLLATAPEEKMRDGREAMKLANEACRLTGFKNSMMVGTLAAACAECGRLPEAVAMAQRASQIASESGDQALAKIHLELCDIYLSGKPYHQPASDVRR